MTGSTHNWRFFRAGGVEQLEIRGGADIAALESLDQKLWVALACPVSGLELPTETLQFLDVDKDGRIRVPDILASIAWLKEVLRSLDTLMKGGEKVYLSALNDKTAVGKELLSAARRVLEQHGGIGGSEPHLELQQVAEALQGFDARRFNGDGVVVADGEDDAVLAAIVTQIIGTVGATPDRSGKPGITQTQVDDFFAETKALLSWQDKVTACADILPLGANTAAAAAAVAAVKTKVDDYFARCRLAAFEARAAGRMNGSEAELDSLATKELSCAAPEIARLPLALIAAGRPLPLSDGVNPAWASAITALAGAVGALLGVHDATLQESQWVAVQGRLAAYQAWCAEKPVTKVEPLGIETLRTIAAADLHGPISELIKKDLSADGERNQLLSLQRLLFLQRDFVTLLNNFVNFSMFYSKSGAAFQAGSLYLDGRRCDLCVRVDDAGKHAALASLAKCYLIYCDCTRQGGEKLSIVAALTAGDSDNLMVGRNGVFYDRRGRDFDATITKIIENPISIRQAFFAPYKSFLRIVEETVAKRAAVADAEASNKIKDAAAQTATMDQTKSAASKEPPKKLEIGTVAAIGVAVGGIATFFTSILALFFGMGFWMPLGLLALMLTISLPSMLIAWLKLRQRNIGPILDANGWATNCRARINVPFGAALTALASIPLGAERRLRDPYQEKHQPWRLYVLLLTLLVAAGLWYRGKVDKYLPAHIKSTTVLGSFQPASPGQAPPAEKK